MSHDPEIQSWKYQGMSKISFSDRVKIETTCELVTLAPRLYMPG
jgi:hypothetical protein